MGTITKKDLVERITEKRKLRRQDVKQVCQDFLEQIIVELRKGNRCEFRDFGVFEVKERAARVAQNPKTMEKVAVAAKRAVKFKVGRLMRESVEMPAPKQQAEKHGTEKQHGDSDKHPEARHAESKHVESKHVESRHAEPKHVEPKHDRYEARVAGKILNGQVAAR